MDAYTPAIGVPETRTAAMSVQKDFFIGNFNPEHIPLCGKCLCEGRANVKQNFMVPRKNAEPAPGLESAAGNFHRDWKRRPLLRRAAIQALQNRFQSII
jgi:hypothetical protein